MITSIPRDLISRTIPHEASNIQFTLHCRLIFEQTCICGVNVASLLCEQEIGEKLKGGPRRRETVVCPRPLIYIVLYFSTARADTGGVTSKTKHRELLLHLYPHTVFVFDK
jgi:hypothetical protein